MRNALEGIDVLLTGWGCCRHRFKDIARFQKGEPLKHEIRVSRAQTMTK